MGRILIIHYHLNPGGVTRIIESQVQALLDAGTDLPVIVLTGKCDNPDVFEKAGVELIVKDQLNYLQPGMDYRKEYQELSAFFSEFLKAGDLIHFHNLNLGKNPVLTCLMDEWTHKGYRLFNHAHDFAEDRPVNYDFLKEVSVLLSEKPLKEILYPAKGNYIFLVLNSPDRERLLEYGVEAARVHLLPNPVVFEEGDEDDLPEGIQKRVFEQLNIPIGKKLVSYPVRVIRRKNIGEYILLCHLFRTEASWVVTQPPKNPVEIVAYEQWKAFCAEYKIPLVFEAGEKADFEELLRGSDFCFTTSMKEGFGMTYMEPWLLNTPVIGRDLPDVTADLKASGMSFPLLYGRLEVMLSGGKKDFGVLSMEEQMDLIRSLVLDPAKGKELFEFNPFLKNLLNSVNNSLIKQNKATILKEYSLSKYGQRLKSIYKEPTR